MDRELYLKIHQDLNLKRKSWALPLHLLQDAILLAGILGAWIGFRDSNLRLVAGPLAFVLIFRGFAIMHEAVHGVVSKNKFVNDLVGLIGGGLCLLPYETWKKSHLSHHQWSGNIEKDPVMALIIVFPKLPRGLQKVVDLSWGVWIPVLSFLQHGVFWKLSANLYRQNPKSGKVIISLLFPIVMWSALFLLTPLAFSVQVLLPALFLYFGAIEVVNLPHHLQLPQYRGEAKFPAWKQYETARSCVYPRWFARFVVLNFNYHIEHHMFPNVPWYHLDKLHEPVKNALGPEYNTDPQLRWILDNKPLPIRKVLSAGEAREMKEAPGIKKAA